MSLAAKEEMLSPSSDPCVFFPLAADPAELETHFGTTPQLRKNSRLGFERTNLAPHQGSAWCNSGTALGIEPALLQSAIRSRCTGKERDSESGLDNFGARYDSSSLGRFMTPDPSSVSGDIVESEFPQSWNMYSYVLNNPLNAVDPDGLDYYLLGGDRCGQDIQCDKQGYVLGSDGNRQVVTDQQINGSNGLAKIDENGNLQINTAQGTFQGQFFDPNIGANGAAIIPQAIVTPTFEEQKFMALQDAGAMATPGVNAALAITSPQLLFMGGATIALSGGGSTLTLEAGAEVTATPGEVASISRAAAQGGRRAVQRALRSYQKRLAEHLAKLNEIKGDPGSVQREINNFRGLIKAAEEYLSKNP
jgi:RHS repeat-associated protein